MMLHRLMIVTVIAVLLLNIGCERDEDTPTGEDPESERSVHSGETSDDDIEADIDDPETDIPRKERADEADQALRRQLMGRVMEVVEAEGFAAAVDVCHEEASAITADIGDEFDVRIGRVSDKLRNPDNTGPDWVWPMIEEAQQQPHYADREQFRAVNPIELAAPCTNCHGDTDELADGVPDILDEHYPDDRATGYSEGDLRGWVWVEVP